jgi:hypothetical protein
MIRQISVQNTIFESGRDSNYKQSIHDVSTMINPQKNNTKSHSNCSYKIYIR